MITDNNLEILSGLYADVYGCVPERMARLSASGGDRVYYRMSSAAGTCLGTVGDALNDCKAFINLDNAFRSHGFDVPEIYAVSDDGMHYLQQDLGDTSLFSLLGSDQWRQMAELTVESLARLHSLPENVWADAVEYSPFSIRQVMWDLNYFKYEYLKTSGIPFDENLLEDDFERFARDLVGNSGPLGFMMRDCQSRNVMIHDRRPWLIDFQGGRKGPVVYDIVSFLWQAKARLTPAVRQELLELYASRYAELTGRPASDIMDAVTPLVLFRTLQVLGAYGFRGLVQRRAHFIESIPFALENLGDLVNSDILCRYPELRRVAEYAIAHCPMPPKHQGLVISVFSFSYKRGYPDDFTGNGGGFMFDCRGMHNPGRYDEFKPLTGLDAPVRDFLEQKGEVARFVDRAVEIVAPSVECYLRRNFCDLQVGFGCTGGRHRSVYCADAFARAIRKRFPEVKVILNHREQSIIEQL